MTPKTFPSSYVAYINGPVWRRQRQAALIKWGKRCNACNRGSAHTIQVHHLAYRNLHDVTPDDLMPLCIACHKKCHEDQTLVGLLLNCVSTQEKRAAIKRYIPPIPRPHRQPKIRHAAPHHAESNPEVLTRRSRLLMPPHEAIERERLLNELRRTNPIWKHIKKRTIPTEVLRACLQNNEPPPRHFVRKQLQGIQFKATPDGSFGIVGPKPKPAPSPKRASLRDTLARTLANLMRTSPGLLMSWDEKQLREELSRRRFFAD